MLWQVGLWTWVIAPVTLSWSPFLVTKNGWVSKCDAGAPFSNDDQRFHHVFLLIISSSQENLTMYIVFFIIHLVFSHLKFSLFPFFIFFTISQTLLCHSMSFYLFFIILFLGLLSSPICCLSLSTSISHFHSLSLSLCRSQWEFGKHSVSLMKKKCYFTPLSFFWFEIKGNVKYPPDTHTH